MSWGDIMVRCHGGTSMVYNIANISQTSYFLTHYYRKHAKKDKNWPI